MGGGALHTEHPIPCDEERVGQVKIYFHHFKISTYSFSLRPVPVHRRDVQTLEVPPVIFGSRWGEGSTCGPRAEDDLS